MTQTPPKDRDYPTQADLDEALQGTDMGSDTRAGSLRGGSASGSDIDPDQELINRRLGQQGQALKSEGSKPAGGPEQAARSRDQPGDEVDAVTG